MNLQWQSLTVPKAGNSPAENEDAIALVPEQARAALCDGASEGWGSGLWARRLAECLVRTPAEPTEFREWLRLARAGAAGIAPPVTSWYAEEKQAQGAFSTLLGIGFGMAADGGAKFHAIAVGDTVMFQIRGGRLIGKFPIEKSEEFSNRPELVGSLPASGEPKAEWFAGRAELGDLFLLLTDALAEWFLREHEAGEKPWEGIQAVTIAVDPNAEFARWVQSLRELKRIKNDDTTLVLARVV